MVTIDAMGGQKAMAKTRTAQGAEDVLARKAPPPTLHGEGHLWGEDGKADRLAPVTSAPHTTTDADHGRLETRHDWSTSDRECGGVQGAGAHSASGGVVESHRDVGGAVSIEPRWCLTSLPGDAVGCAHAVREPWGGAKALHGVRDGSLREDAGRMRQGHGAQNMAALRHRAWPLLRREAGHQRGSKARRKRAG